MKDLPKYNGNSLNKKMRKASA